MEYTLHNGDCIEVLRTMPNNSIDAVVTDPPYGLSFMGKKWDYDVPSADIWRECLRVLKPGGHLLAFAGTRTQHRMAVRIEDAGFEIRDMIAWVYGSGFPKSLDVSKAIDKRRTEDLQPAAYVARWLVQQMEARGIARRDICDHFKAENIAQQWTTYWTDGAVKPRVPKWGQWLELRRWLDLPDDMDGEVWRLNGRKGKPGDNFAEREVVGVETRYNEASGIVSAGRDERTLIERKITAPSTPEAQQWAGWGTALKPALEPITVARKPFTGTVAANVLEHGTGAINVDGCRVGFPRPEEQAKREQTGRWPANLIHDGSEEVLELMGESARFFYCPKASKSDRGDGNHHPTVKPTPLMRYLCRLVTPPNGIVLDPFTGSGSTGKAAILEGFQFIGIEREAQYIEIARARIEHASKTKPNDLGL